jgi:hypothetical protein
MPLIVYPTEGDYYIGSDSFQKIPFYHDVIGKDRMIPDFVISGHYWAGKEVKSINVDNKYPELSLKDATGQWRDISKKTVRVRKKKQSLDIKRNMMTFYHATKWYRAQVVYHLPCNDNDFQMARLEIEIVKVGVPANSYGFVQRVYYDGEKLSYNDFRNWPGWNFYNGWWKRD